MKQFVITWSIGAVLFAVLIFGCGKSQNMPTTSQAEHGQHAESHSDAAEVQTNISKLTEEDRPLALAQGYCAVSKERLGSMGAPLKLVLNDQPVFVCCKGCEKKAKSRPEKALATAEELKAKVKSETD